jgi:AraC-like DNA-binding protein
MSTTTRQESTDDLLSDDEIGPALSDLRLSCQKPVWFAQIEQEQESQKRTSPAIRHVRENFSRRIALKEVADLCRLSPSQFSRTFKVEQHLSFGEFVLRFRLWMALHRLTSNRELVKEVAYAVGFNDMSYFARSFKRYFGTCPSELKTMSMHRVDDSHGAQDV